MDTLASSSELLIPQIGHQHISNIQSVHHEGGLSLLATIVFLAGEMAGSGMLSLPSALANASWTGVGLIITGCLVAGYNGAHLGQCWIMMLERYPEYREHCRAPYPAIAEKAVGMWMRRIVEVAVDLTLFGASLVYIILISQNLHSMFLHLGININFCLWLIITAAFVTPLTWLGSPKDFKWVAVVALSSIAVAAVLVITNCFLDIAKPTHEFEQPDITWRSFFLAYGTILFAFGGASTFPTIQHDMKKPSQFKYAVIGAFAILQCLYMPFAVTGFIAYGEDVKPNILLSLTNDGLRIASQILVTVHLFFAIIIVFNPVSQHIEDLTNIEHKFYWKRIFIRTLMMGIMLFIAEAVPHFGAILDLIGGSTVCFLTFIAPSVFYMKMCAAEGDWPVKPLTLHEKVIHMELILVGILGGLAATYSAVYELSSPGTFVTPCFINATKAQNAQ